MKSTMRNLTLLVGIGLGLLLPVQGGAADIKDLRNLSAEWWQLVSSMPVAENPAFDPTGEKCFLGQRGSTWFLFGAFGGTVTRNCSVPAGKDRIRAARREPVRFRRCPVCRRDLLAERG